MYIVRFIRTDGKPNEEYHYQKMSDAKKHLELFRMDDSDLYQFIDLIESEKSFRICETVTFPPKPLGRWARLRLEYLIKHSPKEYAELRSENSLYSHLLRIEEEAQKTYELVMTALSSSETPLTHDCATMLAEEDALRVHVYG